MRAALLIFAVFLAGCRHSKPTGADLLKPCKLDEGPVDTYCGQLSVSEDRGHPGRKIDLKIVIAPALRRDPKPDPLFILAGGPGAGSAKTAKYQLPLFQRYQTDRDIVFVDQRGTGDSNPLNCQISNKDEDDDPVEDPSRYPVEKFRDCLAKYKADPRLYTTSVASDDLDEVRKYLGYGEINIWGGSYGSMAALSFLHKHEAVVRSIVIDGIAPTYMRLPLYMGRDSQRALDLLVADCGKDNACNSHYPDLKSLVAKTFERADAKPRVKLVNPRTGEPLELTVTRGLVGAIVMSALYSSKTASLLPRLFEQAAFGDFQGFAALAAASEPPEGLISQGMFLSVTCSEDMPKITPADIDRESKNTFLGTFMFDTRMKPCEFWPKGEVPADYYQPVESTKPVLVLSGEDDPVTPPSWGAEVAGHLKNSRHVVMPGAGHGTSGVGCMPGVIGKYLEDPNPSALDVTCVQKQHRPPFFLMASGPGVKR
jgi:hypothetical protein